MTFDEWWNKNEQQYSGDACHMSEYHMAFTVWNAATSEGVQPTGHTWTAWDGNSVTLFFDSVDSAHAFAKSANLKLVESQEKSK